jgi:CO/xanthine dehydrogenase Mo-binding subunit
MRRGRPPPDGVRRGPRPEVPGAAAPNRPAAGSERREGVPADIQGVGEPHGFPKVKEKAMTTIVGQPIPRIDAAAKVTGATQYVADIRLPRMVHAKVLRAPWGHARITRIDLSRAAAHPGVLLAVTGRDLEVEREPAARHRAILAVDRVVFHGQPVAAVVATDPHIAEEALDLIEVEYERLPAVLDPLHALAEDAPLVRRSRQELDLEEQGAHSASATGPLQTAERPSNVVAQVEFKRGDVAQGFAEADVVLEGTYRVAKVHQGYLEPHATIADCDRFGNVTVWTTTQGPFMARQNIAAILGLPETKVKVIGMEVGGGFGAKNILLAPLCARLAQRLRRPVKLVLSRSEDLRAALPAAPCVVEIKTGVRRDGTLTAIEGRVVFAAGAFPGAPMPAGTLLLGASYKFPHLHIRGYEVLTHQVSVGAYRAPGAPQVAFAIESQMDRMAEAIGMDPLAFRLMNAVEEGYPQPNGQPWPRIGLKECLLALREHPAWQRRGTVPGRGTGIAVGGWGGGLQPSSAAVRLNADGTAGVIVGSADITGTNTALVQIAAEALGLPLEDVRLITGDTDTAPWAGTSGGSKIVYTLGNAVKQAAEDARQQLLEIAGDLMDASPADLEIVGRQIRVKGSPDRSIPVRKVTAESVAIRTKYSPILGRGSVPMRRQAPGFTAQLAEVEVDRDTGAVRLTDYVAVQDAGRAINPMAVAGQIQGGAAQSIGYALLEEMMYDEHGRLRNPTLLDYRQATAVDLPPIDVVLVEVPSPDGPYGARGVGEPSIIPAPAAIANAIAHATGVRLYETPMTPERVWRALRAADSPPRR